MVGPASDVQVGQAHLQRGIDRAGLKPIPVIPGLIWALSAQLNDESEVEVSNAGDRPRRFELRLSLLAGASLVRIDHPAGVKDGRPIVRLTLAPHATTIVRYQTGVPPVQ